jgi:aarF domain-containing kinase
MPATQLVEVLTREYGSGWHKRFKRLSFEPIAAASIGQVHRAETHDGRVLALKIQYPGVRQSIDSDVANLGLLARTPGLVPAAIDVAPLLERVREQLHRETDYRAEADALTEYRARLGDDPVLWVPAVVQADTAPITSWPPSLRPVFQSIASATRRCLASPNWRRISATASPIRWPA